MSSTVVKLSWIFQANVTTVDVESENLSGVIVRIDLHKFDGNTGIGDVIKSWWNIRCVVCACCCSDDGIINDEGLGIIQNILCVNTMGTNMSENVECKVALTRRFLFQDDIVWLLLYQYVIHEPTIIFFSIEERQSWGWMVVIVKFRIRLQLPLPCLAYLFCFFSIIQPWKPSSRNTKRTVNHMIGWQMSLIDDSVICDLN